VSKLHSMRVTSGLICALVLLVAPKASRATTAELPPLSLKAVGGHWEGFCEAPPTYTFAVQMDFSSEGQGDVTLGIWFGGKTRVLQDTLPVQRLSVRRGELTVTAGSGRRGNWKSLHLRGNGKADSEAGWIRARLRLPGTAYACDVNLFKESPAYATSYFGGIAELVRQLRRATDQQGGQQDVGTDDRSTSAPAPRSTP